MAENIDKNHSNGAGIHKTRLDYSDAMLLLEIEGLARHGYDDAQIAEIYDVDPGTFSRHKKKKQADGNESLLKQALTRGRRPLAVLVENALYKRAIGQTVKSVSRSKKWLVIDGKAKQYTDEIETETELPGDVGAQRLWLFNHMPEFYNQQLQKFDVTTNGKELNTEPPRILRIEHITIASDRVKKEDVEV